MKADEAAWAVWTKSIKNVDEPGMTLVRVAFEAGYEAGGERRSSP